MKTPEQRLDHALNTMRNQPTEMTLENIRVQAERAGSTQHAPDGHSGFFSLVTGTSFMTLSMIGAAVAFTAYFALSDQTAQPSVTQSTAQTPVPTQNHTQQSSASIADVNNQTSSTVQSPSTNSTHGHLVVSREEQPARSKSDESSPDNSSDVVDKGHRLPIELKGAFLDLQSGALRNLGIVCTDSSVSVFKVVNDTRVEEMIYGLVSGVGFRSLSDVHAADYTNAPVHPQVVTFLDGVLRSYNEPEEQKQTPFHPTIQKRLDEILRQAKQDGNRVLTAYPKLSDTSMPMDKRITVKNDDGLTIVRIALTQEENRAMTMASRQMASESFTKNQLVGVRVVLHHEIGADKGFIFWYAPTPEFIQALPEYYREKLEVELGQRTENDRITAGCQLTVSCLSSMGALNYSQITPNPMSSEAVLHLTLQEERSISAEIFDMKAQFVQSLLSNLTLGKGDHSIPLDVHTLKPGIYLLNIISNKGESIVQRIIRSNDN